MSNTEKIQTSGFMKTLRFPKIFIGVVLLLLVDIVMPDIIPFIDEIILGLVATGLGTMKKSREEEKTVDIDQ